MTAEPSVRDRAAEVLRGHATYQVTRGYILCGCDAEWGTVEAQADHQADALTAAGLLAKEKP